MRVTAGSRSVRPWTAAVFAVLTVVYTPTWGAGAGQRNTGDDSDRLLRGTIDIHVHSDPDNVPRSIDGIDVAKLARARGMR